MGRQGSSKKRAAFGSAVTSAAPALALLYHSSALTSSARFSFRRFDGLPSRNRHLVRVEGIKGRLRLSGREVFCPVRFH
jgi:hypothetical protein